MSADRYSTSSDSVGKGGKIVVEYYSDEELDQIVSRLGS